MRTHLSSLLRRLAVGLIVTAGALPSVAFKPYGIGHWGITEDALGEISATLSSGETLQFRKLPKYQIMTANCLVDVIHYFDPVYHFTDELLAESSLRLIHSKERILSHLRQAEPDGFRARQELGEALHTLQDFYAHSNWVETGHFGAFSALGRQVVPSPGGAVVGASYDYFLNAAPLSTGYFIGLTGCGTPPPGKCVHGTENPITGTELCPGVHKDFPRPGRPYAEANTSALAGSVDYVRQIVDELNALPSPEARDKALTALFGAKSVAFVIDVTGSMGEEIGQVKSEVRTMVENLSDDEDPPSRYILVHFGDPCACEPFVTSDPSRLIAEVDTLYASGGDDCPEYSQTALFKAVNQSSFFGKVYLFTDATAKDSWVRFAVSAVATLKFVTISCLLTGSCSPIDPAYYKNAGDTGGQVYFLQRSEVGNMFALFDAELQNDLMPILIRRRTVIGSDTLPLPVDESIAELTVSLAPEDASGMLPDVDMQLVRPDGSAVTAADPNATIIETSGGKLIRYRTPTPGAWSIAVSGNGLYTVRALASTPLGFEQAYFAQMAGTYAHDGLFPLSGQPTTDQPQTSIMTLRGDVLNPELEILNIDGSHYSSPTVIEDDLNAPPHSLVARFTPPSTSFRMRLTGLSQGGNPVVREVGTLFQGQSTSLSFEQPLPVLDAGVPGRVRVRVRNLGSADTFTVSGFSGDAAVTTVTPMPIAIASGDEAVVEFDTLVADTDVLPSSVSLAATVASVLDPASTNIASADITVAGALSQLDINPGSAISGRKVRGLVFLSGPARAATTVTLSSSRDTAVTYPRTIIVPAGASTGSFEITTRRQGAPVTVTLSARVGTRTRTANLMLTGAPRLASLTAARRSGQSGQTVMLRLTLASPTGLGGIPYDVSTSSGVLTVPSKITVPAGKKWVDFPVRINRPDRERKASVKVEGYGQQASVEILVRP